MADKQHHCKEMGPWHVEVSSFDYWYAFDDNREGVRYIHYCPWCGVKLDDIIG